MKVIDQPNRGQNAALNRALSECSGTFIQYLDADDALEQNKIRNQMIRLEQRPDCIATSTWRVIATAAPVDFVDRRKLAREERDDPAQSVCPFVALAASPLPFASLL